MELKQAAGLIVAALAMSACGGATAATDTNVDTNYAIACDDVAAFVTLATQPGAADASYVALKSFVMAAGDSLRQSSDTRASDFAAALAPIANQSPTPNLQTLFPAAVSIRRQFCADVPSSADQTIHLGWSVESLAE